MCHYYERAQNTVNEYGTEENGRRPRRNMTMARRFQSKRKREDESTAQTVLHSHNQTVLEGILGQYYETVQTLRQYVLARLPASSRLRRKKIASVTSNGWPSNPEHKEHEAGLGRLLDSTLVCVREDKPPDNERFRKWMQLTQNGDELYASVFGGTRRVALLQSEVKSSQHL